MTWADELNDEEWAQVAGPATQLALALGVSMHIGGIEVKDMERVMVIAAVMFFAGVAAEQVKSMETDEAFYAMLERFRAPGLAEALYRRLTTTMTKARMS